jgi:hypothetical protein
MWALSLVIQLVHTQLNVVFLPCLYHQLHNHIPLIYN